ncbi:restriction endonuclease [Variovorax sp. LjRoot290]|uniref:restriction endonuclease n=1 Tax=Variovorax sp. LjRoot290 TaxID=3342316 RepID=UPI003ED01D2B
MARRKKNGTADDVIELVAMLPWWAGVGTALVSYVVLHALAAPAAVVAARPDQLAQMVTSSMWKALAYVGQFLVPLLCLIGALVSALRRHKRRTLVDGVVAGGAADILEGISWREFEMLVGEGFRLQGYQVLETGGKGADGGVDLRLRKNGEKFLVQCKQWKAFKVGVQVVRELYGVMAAEDAVGGMAVTSGRFTREAEAFAKGRNIQLIDGPALLGLIRCTQETKSAGTSQMPHGGNPARTKPLVGVPTCPVCAGAMIRRTAKRGANAGGEFWGCVSYPACKGTRS